MPTHFSLSLPLLMVSVIRKEIYPSHSQRVRLRTFKLFSLFPHLDGAGQVEDKEVGE